MSEEVLVEGMKVDVTKEGGSAELPKGFCPSSFNELEGCNRSFSVTAIGWPGITHVGLAVVIYYINFTHRLDS